MQDFSRQQHIISRLQAGCGLLVFFFSLLVNISCSSLPYAGKKTPNEVVGKPTTTPQLRIETGLHTAAIRRISVDKLERFVVSVAADKTARVWDLNNGSLLQILRPPIADGNEGILSAVAISPHGEQVAVAGWTGFEWEGTTSIYIFDRATGEMQGRILNLPHIIHALAYSVDGKVLAATLGAGEGVRFFAVPRRNVSYREIARDADYSNDSYSIDFDQQGRSVTTSFDGFIRLYDNKFNRFVKKQVQGGKQPYFARFSPDGKRIVVGFYDSDAVDLFSADDLSLLDSPETKPFAQEDFSIVAWSQDGRRLYAGGRGSYNTGNPVIVWSAESFTADHIYPVSQQSLMDIQPLADGGFLFASADPVLGRLDARGKVIWKQRAGKLDYSGGIALRQFSLSDGASILGFHYRYETPQGNVEHKIARWNLTDLSFSNVADLNGLSPPRLTVSGLDVQDWEVEEHPSLNGEGLILEDHEISRSLAISTRTGDKPQSFVLGTEWNIRLYDHQGQLQWLRPVPVAWAVNISVDQRYVVAALGDGTIRWYQFEDGLERLAFYLHPDAVMDKPRWIAWTPEGFYAASAPDAEELVGFHLNQGADQVARFVDAGQLSEVFARADLVRLALDKEEYLSAFTNRHQADDIQHILAAGIAPRIHLYDEDAIKQNKRKFDLVFSLEDLGGGIGKLEYHVDGKLVSSGGSRPFAPRNAGGQQGFKRSFTLPQGKHILSVRAYNKNNNIASKPAEVIITVDDPVHREPSLYVLSVGISSYRDQHFNLKYAADDAIDFASTLEKQGQLLYKHVVTKTLVDKEATLRRIGTEFEEMARIAQPQDVFVFYLAGHGTVSDGRYHFIPYELIYENEASLKQALNEARLKELLASVETGKRMMVVDSCHAGQAIPALAALAGERGIKDKSAISRLMNATGIAILAATSKEQEAKEGIIENGVGHGLFTHVLLKGLRGAADGRMNKDGQIDVEELISYTRTEVPRISMEKWNQEQFPMHQAPQQNFPIGLVSD